MTTTLTLNKTNQINDDANSPNTPNAFNKGPISIFKLPSDILNIIFSRALYGGPRYKATQNDGFELDNIKQSCDRANNFVNCYTRPYLLGALAKLTDDIIILICLKCERTSNMGFLPSIRLTCKMLKNLVDFKIVPQLLNRIKGKQSNLISPISLIPLIPLINSPHLDALMSQLPLMEPKLPLQKAACGLCMKMCYNIPCILSESEPGLHST